MSRVMLSGLIRSGSRALAFLAATAAIAMVAGCVIVCGPIHTVPKQKLHVMAPAPSIYTIRVAAGGGGRTDTPVPANGRVAFDVPIASRYCTSYLFGILKVTSQTPVEKRHVIRVMRGDKVERKLSAEDISRLPVDSDGYHVLKMND